MREIIIDLLMLALAIVIALIPTNSEVLFWLCWGSVVAWIVFLAADIGDYRKSRR